MPRTMSPRLKKSQRMKSVGPELPTRVDVVFEDSPGVMCGMLNVSSPDHGTENRTCESWM